jgi:hypothetical protein
VNAREFSYALISQSTEDGTNYSAPTVALSLVRNLELPPDKAMKLKFDLRGNTIVKPNMEKLSRDGRKARLTECIMEERIRACS